LEAGIGPNSMIQLWDDNPLWVVKNTKSLMTKCFRPLGYGVRVRIYKLKNKIIYNENEKVLRKETFQMLPIHRKH